MITITEKDGATVIVVENPTANEERVIKKAKEVMNQLSSDDLWAKFKKNGSSNSNSDDPWAKFKKTGNSAANAVEKTPTPSEIDSDDDYPF